jgi:hypothetical protein
MKVVILIMSTYFAMVFNYWFLVGIFITILTIILINSINNIQNNNPLTTKYNTPFTDWCGQSTDDIWKNMSNDDQKNIIMDINSNINTTKTNLDKNGIKY